MSQVIPENLDFQIKSVKNGYYEIVESSTQATLPGANTLTLGGGAREIWSISPGAINLENIEHEYTFTAVSQAVATAAHGYLFVLLNVIPLRQIIFSYNNQQLLNLSNAYIYNNMTGNAFMTKDEFLAEDIGSGFTGAAVGTVEFSRKSNSALGASGVLSTSGLNYQTRPGGVANNVAYNEFMYTAPGARNAAKPVLAYRWKLSKVFRGTIFSSVKEDFVVNGNCTIELVYEGLDKWTYTANSNQTAVSRAATTVACTVGSQKLKVPYQRDPEILDELQKQFNDKGLKYVFDDVLLSSFSLQGTAQNWSFVVPQGVGQSIKMLGFSAYNNSTTSSTALEHSEVDTTAKITSFYTTSNGKRNEAILINLGNHDDFRIMKNRIPDSPIMMSSNIYHYNWVWLMPLGYENCRESIDSDEIQGYDLSQGPYTYSFFSTTANATHMYWVFAIVQKIVLLKPGLVSIS